MTEIILAFVLGAIFGVIALIVVCCAIVSKENKEPKDKDEWRGLP